jgi:hypothetical protein
VVPSTTVATALGHGEGRSSVDVLAVLGHVLVVVLVTTVVGAWTLMSGYSSSTASAVYAATAAHPRGDRSG